MRSSLTDTPLGAPVNVTWEVTRACNLECRHCLSAELRAARPPKAAAVEAAASAPASGDVTPPLAPPVPGQRAAEGVDVPAGVEMDLAQCQALVHELARMQVFQVNFGGGEPFLRRDFLDILECVRLAGITACVSTNGTVLDEALVDALLGMAEPAPVYLQVSLDGARAATNDAIRGAGTFDRILAGIELLAARDYPGLSLNMVVTRLNAAEIGEFDRLARNYGAKTRLSRFRPSGAGCNTWDDYRLDREQLLELSAFLGEHAEILTGDSFFALAPESRRDLGLTMCGAAKMTCAVAPDGGVYPCAFLSDPVFLAGNVTTQPLSAIFHSSPVFEQFRQLEVQSCRSCDRFSVCHGGCPAVGYFLTGSTDLPDPECLRAVTPRYHEAKPRSTRR